MEKEQTDSMATVQMKSDYAASEVYSTTSEAPPAYRHKSTSVQIAKIIALTVIASSFIIGSFILAATYMQARASCDQMQALDSVLEKELMLETLQQELPKAEALLQTREITENDLQNLEKDIVNNKDVVDSKKEVESSDNASESSDSESADSSFSDSDESGEMNRVHIKLPLELDLSDLANALLENNQKSRMNCVVERRRAEEFVDAPAKTMQLPFGVNLTTDPKRQRVTGERMAIFCESGSEVRNDQAEQIPPFMMPPRYIPYGAIPQQVPLTHMPQQQMPQQHMPQQQMPPQMQMHQMPMHQMPMHQMPMHQMPPQQQQQQQQQPQPPQMSHQPQFPQQFIMRPMSSPQPQNMVHQMPPPVHQMPPHPPVPDQIMQAPRPEQQQQPTEQTVEQSPPEFRIQLQRVPLPIRGELSEPVQIREMPIQMQGRDIPHMPQQVQVQRIPLAVALQRAGITPEDLRNIQRMAEERIHQELRQLAAEDSSSSSDSSSDSSDEDESNSESEQQQPQILQMGRGAYGRSLITPVRIPVNMMMQEESHDNPQPDRPHFVQPRSVRSVDSVLKGEKRVKRCACDCNC